MAKAAIGWLIDEIRKNIRFETTSEYTPPDVESYDDYVNDWWKDLFNYLKQYEGVDVLTIGRYIDTHFLEDPIVIGIRLTEARGGRATEDGYPEDGSDVVNDTQALHSLSSFCHDQSNNGCILPSPKVFISGHEVSVDLLHEWISHELECMGKPRPKWE